jgi:epoxyqueuosine reductase
MPALFAACSRSMVRDLSDRVKQCAVNAGFDLCGIASVGDFRELDVFPEWIADGKHGEMKYMAARNEAGDLKRAALARVAPWTRSVIVCAVNYNTAHPYTNQSPQDHFDGNVAGQGWISRYAWGHEDYHDAVLRRLRQMEGELRELVKPTQESLQLRSYVDTGPLLERVYAKYAGIGWIGKNTCIINQRLGSWLFLGVILTSLQLAGDKFVENLARSEPSESEAGKNELIAGIPAPDRCGSCTRCIAACPTQAIIAPYQLDARLCISYLTIEKRGEIPVELRAGIGRHVFGCDICQDVCPWNRKAPITSAPEFEPRPGLLNPDLDWLAKMQPAEFREKFRGSPVKRAKLSGLRRNAAIAMGNSGDKKFMPTLEHLTQDSDSIVAEHAQWALAKLR